MAKTLKPGIGFTVTLQFHCPGAGPNCVCGSSETILDKAMDKVGQPATPAVPPFDPGFCFSHCPRRRETPHPGDVDTWPTMVVSEVVPDRERQGQLL